jgi:hypothetical protein
MTMMLSDASTQVLGSEISYHDRRETGPTLSSKYRNLRRIGQLKFMLRRREIHGLTHLRSMCSSSYLNETNEVVGSELSISPGIGDAVGPLGSSHHTWAMNSWSCRCEKKHWGYWLMSIPWTASRLTTGCARLPEALISKWKNCNQDLRYSTYQVQHAYYLQPRLAIRHPRVALTVHC